MPTLYWPFSTSTVTEWPASPGRPNHWGTDFGVPQGTPLKATVDGTIIRHNNDGLGAYVLDIISDDGLLVRNGHLSRMDVNTGQRVTAGQVIGLTGGRPGTPGAGMSTGPHLHWELRWDRVWSGGRWVDPRKLNPPLLNFGDVPVKKKDGSDVLMINKIGSSPVQWAIFGPNFWLEFTGNDTANAFALQSTSNGLSVPVSAQFWDYCKQVATSPVQVNVNASGSVDAQAVARAVNDEIAKRMQG